MSQTCQTCVHWLKPAKGQEYGVCLQKSSTKSTPGVRVALVWHCDARCLCDDYTPKAAR